MSRLGKPAPSGWVSGFFRVAATPDSGQLQMFYNSKTGKFKASPYDFDDPEWDPIYIYCGLPEKKAGQR